MMNYLIGIGSIVGLMVIWIGVQNRWMMTFSEEATDNDALAGRSSCGNCGCTATCDKKNGSQKRNNENNLP